MRFNFITRSMLGLASIFFSAFGVRVGSYSTGKPITTSVKGILLPILLALAASGCSKLGGTEWVDVGVGPENIEEIPFRLIEVRDSEHNKTIPKTNNDLVSLTLRLQSGSSRGTWVYLPIRSCWSPSIRGGVPTLMCTAVNRADVFVGGEENIREVLLAVESEGKKAAIKGKVLGLHADTPVVWVVDPGIKREVNR